MLVSDIEKGLGRGNINGQKPFTTFQLIDNIFFYLYYIVMMGISLCELFNKVDSYSD